MLGKRILAGALCLCLALGLCVPAGAGARVAAAFRCRAGIYEKAK